MSRGSKTKERTGESRDAGLKTNGNPKTSERGERSWRLARCGRFRVNWVVIFFLRGGFFIPPDSAGSMAQRDNRHSFGYLACTPPTKWPYGPLSDAAKYPAGARPSKCIIIREAAHQQRESRVEAQDSQREPSLDCGF
jgi:hypothetical protein